MYSFAFAYTPPRKIGSQIHADLLTATQLAVMQLGLRHVHNSSAAKQVGALMLRASVQTAFWHLCWPFESAAAAGPSTDLLLQLLMLIIATYAETKSSRLLAVMHC